MIYIIYRGSWRRGGDNQILTAELGDTSLYQTRTNMMCCLGQCAFEAGVPLDKLREIGEPAYVDAESILIPAGLLSDDYEDGGRQSLFSNRAIAINDDETIGDERREELLVELATRFGHEITFVDGIAPWFKSEAA